MLKRSQKSLAAALLLAVTTTVITPVTPAYAFSVTDLAPVATKETTKSSGSNGFMDLLMGLLLGKLFSNMSNTGSNTASPASTISKVLGLTADSASSTEAPASATGTKLIDTAKQYMGVPYVWGGETPAGFDCSGFTQYVMKQNGIAIPRTAAEQFATGTPVDKANLRVGDLVFFTTYKPGASHVGFYMGDGKFIHASSASEKVAINSLSETFYTEHWVGARRYF